LRLGITVRIRTIGTILIASTGCAAGRGVAGRKQRGQDSAQTGRGAGRGRDAAGRCRADGGHTNAAPTRLGERGIRATLWNSGQL